MTWELTLARPLLIVHALAGTALLAVAVHLFVALLQRNGARQAQRYALLVGWLALGVFASGALVYPAFRVSVRAAWMDANAPALTGIFEIKEHWAALALVLAWAIWRLRRDLENVPAAVLGARLFAGLLVAIAGFNVLSGLWLVMVRSV